MDDLTLRSRMVSDKVAIATTTYYNPDRPPDMIRAELAKGFVRRATDLGYKPFIVDGGSPDELLRDFERYGATILEEVKTDKKSVLGPGRRQAIQAAYNSTRPVVAWIEPEKEPYVIELVKTVEPILQNEADMVIPKRKSLESYPKAQQIAEPIGNRIFELATGKDLDVWFGPRTFEADISKYFLEYKGEYGDMWASTFVPVARAIHYGKDVIGVEVDYVHPTEQRESEEQDQTFTEKRIAQLDELSHAINECHKELYNDEQVLLDFARVLTGRLKEVYGMDLLKSMRAIKELHMRV